MQVEVHIRNGRTVFRFAKRAHLLDAIRRNQEKDFEGRRLFAQVKHNPDDPEWRTASVRSLSPSSISFVLEIPPAEKFTPEDLKAGASQGAENDGSGSVAEVW